MSNLAELRELLERRAAEAVAPIRPPGNRLSDEGLRFLDSVREMELPDEDTLDRAMYYAGFAVAELRERRAADLSDEEREALLWMRERHLAENNPNNVWTLQAIGALDRLLAAAEGKS